MDDKLPVVRHLGARADEEGSSSVGSWAEKLRILENPLDFLVRLPMDVVECCAATCALMPNRASARSTSSPRLDQVLDLSGPKDRRIRVLRGLIAGAGTVFWSAALMGLFKSAADSLAGTDTIAKVLSPSPERLLGRHRSVDTLECVGTGSDCSIMSLVGIGGRRSQCSTFWPAKGEVCPVSRMSSLRRSTGLLVLLRHGEERMERERPASPRGWVQTLACSTCGEAEAVRAAG